MRLDTILRDTKKISSEKRLHKRSQLYSNDGVEAVVTTKSGLIRGHLLDVDNSGVAVAVLEQENWQKLDPGDDVEIEISFLAIKRSSPVKATVQNKVVTTNHAGEYCRIGLKMLGPTQTRLSMLRQSGFHSHSCPEFFRPVAYCENPVFFNEVVHLQIEKFYPNGLVAVTSSRNKGFFPGFCFKMSVYIPGSGEFTLPVRVLCSEELPNNKTLLELVFLEKDADLLAAIGEFIMSYSEETTPKLLKEQGFFLDAVFNAIRVSYISSRADWEEILRLRLLSYHSVGKMLDRNDLTEMIDPFDGFARHVVAKHMGKVIGAGRVVFVGTDIERSEHHRMGVELPKDVIERGFVEISRVCVHPDYRGSDFFVTLLRHVSKIGMMASVGYAVANCNEDLWNFYKELGWKRFGKPFNAFGRDDCRLIYVDRTDILLGKVGSISTWNYVFAPLWKFLLQGRSGAFWHRAQCKIRMFISGFVLQKKRKKRFKKHLKSNNES